MTRPMTNIYYEIDNKRLMTDHKVILLMVAIKYCEENKVEKIRYSVFRRLCDEKLEEVTGGLRTSFGGSFEAYLKKMSDTESDSSERLFTRQRSMVTRKDSQLYPNIPLIRSYLQKIFLSNLYSDRGLVTKQIRWDASILESNVKVLDTAKATVFHTNIRNFMRDVRSNLSYILGSDLFNIHFSTYDNNELNLSDDVKNSFVSLAEKIVEDKRLRQHQFVLTIQYKGEPNSVVTLNESIKSSKFYESLTTGFVEWARRFHTYVLNESDKQRLVMGNVTTLTRGTRLKLKLFLEQILLEEDNVNTLKPIMEEIVQKL